MNMLKKLKTNFASFLSDHKVKKFVPDLLLCLIQHLLTHLSTQSTFSQKYHSPVQHLYLRLSNCRTPLEVSGETIGYLAQRYLDRRTQGSMRQPSNCGLPTLLSESQLPTKQINACVLFSSTGFLFNPLRLKFSFSC